MSKDKEDVLPKSSTKITKKQLIEILIVCVLMGIGLLIYDYYDTQINFDGTIARNQAGEGNTSEKKNILV